MADTKFCVSWEAYQKSMCNGLSSLQQRGEFVDMTLAAEGHHVKVHQMVMSLVSPYIRDLISSAACPHPVIFLNRVSYETLQSILQYAYTGEVVVSNDIINEFFTACKELRIRGLEDCMNSLESASAPQLSTTQNQKEINPMRDRLQDPLPYKKSNPLSPATPENSSLVYESDDSTSIVDSPVSHNMDVKMRSVVNNCKAETEGIPKTAETTFKYTMSNQGAVQIMLNRYIYSYRYTKKSGDTMWRCCSKCRAWVMVRRSRVIKRALAHNHPYHDAQILKRIRNRNIYTTIYEAESAINKKKEQADTTHVKIPIDDGCDTLPYQRPNHTSMNAELV